jgi:hypothetical protein
MKLKARIWESIMQFGRNWIRLAFLILSLSSMIVCVGFIDSAFARPPHPRTEVGIRCQQEYQNGWQVDVGNSDVWRRCGNFSSQMSQTDNVEFNFNLHGAKQPLEKNNDGCGQSCGGADSVDIFYMNTHSGVNSTTAFWAMWDQNSNALTSNMRLGDNSRQLMVLATFSCSTLLTSDGNALARWIGPFSGGLVMTVGAHDVLYSGNDQSATEYASRMQDGEPIGQAWLESTWYADNRNAPSAMAAGNNANDCWNRMGVSLPSLFTTPVLRDAQIGYVCWSTWN